MLTAISSAKNHCLFSKRESESVRALVLLAAEYLFVRWLICEKKT